MLKSCEPIEGCLEKLTSSLQHEFLNRETKMKATEAKLLQILGAVSQRTYSWTLKECQQLWADILRAGATEEIGVHFIGSVVHIDEGLWQPSRIHLYTSRRWPICRKSTISS